MGDCLLEMSHIASASVQAIVTDLPYGTTSCKWDVIIPFEPMWKEAKRVLKPNGSFITTSSQPFSSLLVSSNIKMFKYEWIWDKKNPSGSLYAKYAPMKQHENILVFGKGKIKYNPQFELIDEKDLRYRKNGRGFKQSKQGYDGVYGDIKVIYREETGKRYPKSIISINRMNGGKLHPTQKPLSLYKYLVETYTDENDVVLDIAMGSGTTGLACRETNRDFIGIEKEKKYFDIAVKELSE